MAIRVIVGIVIPALLILIGLHDVLTGRALFVFSGSEFRDNVARYTLVETAARISGVAIMGLGIGLGLRNLGGLLGRKHLPTDTLATPLIIVSVLFFLLAHWFLPGYVSLSG